MKHLVLSATVVALVILIIGGTFVYLNFSKPGSGALESVSVGHVPVESFALLYVAQTQGFFVDNGLDVTVIDYSTGTTAVNALTSGDIDVGGSSEYVVAVNAVEKQNISIVASCAESQFVDLIGRNDHGIVAPEDLNGKTIGTAKGTVAEFDLGLFLEANGMSIHNITLVYLLPSDFAAAIVNGTVDAVVSWQPYTESVKAQLGTGYAQWPLQMHMPFYSVLSVRNDWLTSHPETTRKLLNSLAQAQDYLKDNPAKTQQIIQNRFNYADDYMATVWSRNNCTVSLTPMLTYVMQTEATWMINNNLTTQKTEPIIANYIHIATLKEVKLDAVTIP